MKHSNTHRFRDILLDPQYLMWAFPILLILPNIALCITEQMPLLAKLTNIILPFGVYCLIMAASKNCGRSILFCIPLMAFAVFQLLLLYFFGESIIAIDMFLNVATTNVDEVSEVLGPLILVILILMLLYLPIIILSIIAVVKHHYVGQRQHHIMRKFSLYSIGAGIVCLILSYFVIKQFSISKDIFPINVLDNAYTAIKRTLATGKYAETSAHFTYDATSTHDNDEKEIYVLVIGETSRASNWQLLGYDKETNPQLTNRNDIIAFDHALTESNTTHKSVPMIMSVLDAQNFNSIYSTKSIITAFKEAGFATAFLSNQHKNHSFIDFFGEEADVTHQPESNYILINPDGCLLKPLMDFIKNCNSNKIFIVLHTYGHHFDYKERYPAEFSFFKPDDTSNATYSHRENLINAYDNSIRYTDSFLCDIIAILQQTGYDAGMIYASDHGEDIFDDNRRRFLHASPTPTYYQLHIPMLLWLSDSYNNNYPQKFEAAKNNSNKNISSSLSVFHTLMDIAGLSSPLNDSINSVTCFSFKEPTRIYLNDRNEAVPLDEAGLKKVDTSKLDELKIN